MKKYSGYTLIEILVVITIIGILFTVGFVSFRDFSRRQALLGAAKNLQGDLRLAQGLALSGKKPDDANCTGTNTLEGYNFKVNSGSNYTLEAGCTGGSVVTKSVDMPSDISISTPSPNPILFKSVGEGTNLESGTSTTITLTQAVTGSTVVVTISASGDIQ